eukprot:c3377_g1_i1.p1 GENE.c3377_g1_i1~~c3377_g1_i1.p1  ORF type:complete len:125 (-),score=16.33 c3377_g1_i1:20-361(-)
MTVLVLALALLANPLFQSWQNLNEDLIKLEEGECDSKNCRECIDSRASGCFISTTGKCERGPAVMTLPVGPTRERDGAKDDAKVVAALVTQFCANENDFIGAYACCDPTTGDF